MDRVMIEVLKNKLGLDGDKFGNEIWVPFGDIGSMR